MKHLKTFEQYIILEEHPFDTYSGPNIKSGLADRIGKNFNSENDGIIASARMGGEFGGNNSEPTSTPEKRRWKQQRTPKKKPSKNRLNAIQKIDALQKELQTKDK